RDLCAIMLADSANIQVKDAEFLARRHREHAPPLYEPEDALRAMRLMTGGGAGASSSAATWDAPGWRSSAIRSRRATPMPTW
ncbi:MAG: hypothetical protein MUF21_12010, partial [Gemmatimonadaceae bacterium]|nr:hypothetical protein [Gemmatimonadaceae bacterium]